MKILLDMNISPRWVPILEARGFSCIHWVRVGDPQASDRAIMTWAAANDYSVLTSDMDFNAALAATQAKKPSVILIRAKSIRPESLEPFLIEALKKHLAAIETGAVVVVEKEKSRVRILPIMKVLKD